MLDSDNYLVNVKGNTKTLSRNTCYIITARKSIRDTYRNCDSGDIEGLYNRFVMIREFTKKAIVKVYPDMEYFYRDDDIIYNE